MTLLPCKAFGQTGETCTAISMGCGFPIGFAGFDRSVTTVRRAFELGVRYFDTSAEAHDYVQAAVVDEAHPNF